MSEEKIESEKQEEVENNTDNLIDALNQLKQNSVSKDKYNELVAQNKKLLEDVINGKPSEESETPKEDPVDLSELREKLFNKREQTNLEYVENALKLRNEIIARGGRDPFLPNGHNYAVQQSDIETAQKVADVFQECIDYAEGDSEAFTNELQRRTNNTIIRR